MTIDTMLSLCHACSIVHFPQGIEVVRDDIGFVARITTRNGSLQDFNKGRGATAQRALDDLANYITTQAREYAERKQREALEAADTVAALLDAKGGA